MNVLSRSTSCTKLQFSRSKYIKKTNPIFQFHCRFEALIVRCQNCGQTTKFCQKGWSRWAEALIVIATVATAPFKCLYSTKWKCQRRAQTRIAACTWGGKKNYLSFVKQFNILYQQSGKFCFLGADFTSFGCFHKGNFPLCSWSSF